MTAHVQPSTSATSRRASASARSPAPATQPTPAHPGAAARHLGTLWRALEAFGAARARQEMARAAWLHGSNRPELAALLRAAAKRLG
jgi:hypothetical protein